MVGLRGFLVAMHVMENFRFRRRGLAVMAPAVLAACAALPQPPVQPLHYDLGLLPDGLDAPDARPAQQALRQMLPARLEECLAALRASPVVRVVDDIDGAAENGMPDQGQPLVLAGSRSGQPLLYLRRYWVYERSLAAQIHQRIQAQESALDEAQARAVLQRLFPASGGGMDWQKLACALALRARLSIITGGPGTGKTHTAARLLALLWSMARTPQALRVALAAPTGKAAARLKQSIDAALLPVQAFCVFAQVLMQIVLAADLNLTTLAINHWQLNAVVYCYQLSSLVLPSLAPVLLWLLLDRNFVRQTLTPLWQAQMPGQKHQRHPQHEPHAAAAIISTGSSAALPPKTPPGPAQK